VRSIVFVLWLLTAPAVFAQEDRSARQVLDDCIESAADDAVGVAVLEEQCPGIEQSLVDLGLDPFIADSQWDSIGVYGLITLRSVADRYSAPPPARTVQTDSLHSILDELKQPAQAEQTLTWLERFKRWLRKLMGEQESASESWLSRWLEGRTLSETAQVILFYGALILVLALAAAVIINEVRVALKGRRKRDRMGGADAGIFSDALAARSLDLEAAARHERPSILLQMLVAALVKTGRLQAERSLTHRELIGRAKFDDSSQRESFSRVARLAERVVYGGDEAPAELDDVVQAGRALHSQLSGVSA
jgi:hypothetical protein